MKLKPLSLVFCLAVLTACGASTRSDPVMVSTTKVKAVPIAEGLDTPWAIAFLPEGDMLVTERPGQVRLIKDGALSEAPLSGFPETYAARQGGYFDIELDPDFEANRHIYLSYAAGTAKANHTALFKARLKEDLTGVEEGEIIYRSTPDKDTPVHFGGRILFNDDDTLFLTLGDGFSYMREAQNPDSQLGKIVRMTLEGKPAEDNPFADGRGDPYVYSYGHRNIQGIDRDGVTGALYAHEHGPKGGDEINLIEPGANYGWPKISYGVNYDGSLITNKTEMEGMEQPVVMWNPSIAPSGFVIYSGDAYPEWRGDMFVGALAGAHLRRVDREDGAVKGQEILLKGTQIREIVESPDGKLYIATFDGADSGVYRLEIE